ncbi:MAG: SMP-30/gluconolactonase/LRE family protein [Gemmatimonadota bacterium]|nr:SMP-30/gluconolactonase/LRE family protein [Gemmatimonadota bacterium]MDH3477184.1 SMP-30/gluconolactonase/LRE family protein [Gemmatimonadota bacterium]MDH5551365.1 SMP-30/gluconolactonase/LRE family protein [Gemmatimonadota bacterium]
MTGLLRKLLLAAALLGLAGGCSRDRQAEQPAEQLITVADVGLRSPESVLHDQVADRYLVTNVNGSSLAKDGNGFVSRLAPDGSLEALKWIDGTTPDVTLHAPKGMAIRGDTLFVADIDAVRLFDRVTGAAVGSWRVPGATFLNDIALTSDGTVYVTDTGLRAGAAGLESSGTDAVYRFDASGTPEPLVSGTALGGPNGIVVDKERIVVVTYRTGRVILIDAKTGQISGLPAPERGQLDGIAVDADGSYLMSSWEGSAVYRMQGGGLYVTAVTNVETPADIGIDRKRKRLLIPLFAANRVLIRPLAP